VKQTLEWRSASDPPTLRCNELFLMRSSEPVLAYCEDGEILMAVLQQYDDDDHPVWYSNCSEHWCLGSAVVCWAYLYPPDEFKDKE
jgi:uncharacterized membrane protein